MRIAVFGAGGVGGYFGGRLAQAGHEVSYVARGDHLKALRSTGLRVTSPKGDFAIAPVTASDTPKDLPPAEVVLLAVKTWQLEEAVKGVSAWLDRDTFVVPLLNGVEATGQVARALGQGRVVTGLARIISHIVAPGHILHVGAEPYVAFGEQDNHRSDRLERLREAFDRTGIRAEIPEDIDAALWRKFLFVVSVGGVGAVTRAPIGVFREMPETRRLLEGAMQEVFQVARARGIRLPAEVVAESMAFADTLPSEGVASIQRDIADGRPSELEAWNGAAVRLGREAGVATPIHEFIYASLSPWEHRARGTATFV